MIRLPYRLPVDHCGTFLFILSLSLRKLQRIQRKHLTFFLLLALFEPFLYFIGECYGVNLISPTLAAILLSLIPLLAPIPAWFLFRERFTFINFLGLIISVAGVTLVVMGEGDIKTASIGGILLMLLAVFSAVCHSVFARKLDCQLQYFYHCHLSEYLRTYLFYSVILFYRV